MGQKRKKNKKLFILVPILLLALVGAYNIYKLLPKKNENVDSSKVLNIITQELNLNTVVYKYNNIVSIKKDISIKNFKIPFTGKSFVIKYNGVINGGIKTEDIKIISKKNDSISLKIKKCSILDHYVDDENVYLYDVSNSIFNRVEAQEVLEDLSKHKKEYEKKVMKEGFIDEVKNSTEKSMIKALQKVGFKDINIEFE